MRRRRSDIGGLVKPVETSEETKAREKAHFEWMRREETRSAMAALAVLLTENDVRLTPAQRRRVKRAINHAADYLEGKNPEPIRPRRGTAVEPDEDIREELTTRFARRWETGGE